MPSVVAVIALLAGLAVIAFALVLTRIDTTVDHAQMPRATLEPVTPQPPTQRREGDVRGVVRTPRRAPVPDVRVTLRPLFEDEDAKPLTTRTRDDGSFSFSDVAIDLGSPWIAEVSYDRARFSSPVLRRPTERRSELELVVARTTRRPGDVRVRVESLAVAGDEQGVQALHAISVTNRGRRAYVGGLPLPLLPGATAIREGAGVDRRNLELGHGEMISTAPVLPGAHELTYTYVAQMPAEGLRLTREVALPTDRYELLVSGKIAASALRGLRASGEVELGTRGSERTYERYVARGLDPRDAVGARIEPARGPDVLRIGAMIAAAAIAVVIVLFPLLRRRRRTHVAEPEREISQTPA